MQTKSRVNGKNGHGNGLELMEGSIAGLEAFVSSLPKGTDPMAAIAAKLRGEDVEDVGDVESEVVVAEAPAAPVKRKPGRPRKNPLANGVPAPDAKQSLDKLGAKLPRAAKSLSIDIPELKLGIMTLTLKGTTPLIMNKFSNKALRQIAEKQQGRAQQKRGAKDPEADCVGALHVLDGSPEPKIVHRAGRVSIKGKFGFPSSGFKKCAVYAADQVGLRASQVNKAFHVLGVLTEIKGSDPVMREDFVRVGGISKSADIRYRPEFETWSVQLTIRYNSLAITPQQIANLYNLAGFAIGIGDWRPQRGGQAGMFEVARDQRALISGG